MLKPVTILALDEVAMTLAQAVQQRVAKSLGLDDLVQARAVVQAAELAPVLQSIHAQRQRPDTPLRLRDDISARELVLLFACATGPARAQLLDFGREVRQLYERRRFASAFHVEALCLLPEVAASNDYAGAYGLLKALSAAEPAPFDEVWLLDAMNATRVHFGTFDTNRDSYADAVAGALLFEPELSGALPGLHPRGVTPAFSTFGYASLVFPRVAALQRLESRFAAALIGGPLLGDVAASGVPAMLRAKQFVAGDSFAMPLSRIGVDAGQSLFRRFQAKTLTTEHTRSAEEVISAVRREVQLFRDGTHLQNLERLARQGEETATELATLVARTADETLDRDGYDAAIAVFDAFIDPLPDLRSDADVSARNIATSIHDATAALDQRLSFIANSAASGAARKRVRELDGFLRDQQVVAETLAPADATERLDALRRERQALADSLPEMLFREEAENNVARIAARDAEASRLAAETEAREQQLRELFAQRPRAEQTLREALEARRSWLWRQVAIGVAGVAALYALPLFIEALRPGVGRIHDIAATWLVLLAIFSAFRYVTDVMPRVRAAREALARLVTLIETADRAKNSAHADELQFEYDVAHRRTSIDVLRRVRDSAATTLAALRDRSQELHAFASSPVPQPIVTSGLAVSIIEDRDVDAWYERTTDDRKRFVREFPIRRSASLHLPFDTLRAQVTAYAASAFNDFRRMTLAGAATTLTTETRLGQCLRRFAETSAPLIELRDDDLPAQQAMQRDVTLWIDASDANWLATVQRRLPGAQTTTTADRLAVHAVSRFLHYPGYILGQFEHYRAEYEGAATREFEDVRDLLPDDLAVSGALRTAYEEVLLGRAVGVIHVRDDGHLVTDATPLGASNHAVAQRLASPDGATLRQRVQAALAPRLEIARDVARDLQQLTETPLSALERGIVKRLMERYAE